jgi:4-hydroxy-tetrahydrodipicolinate synthase
MTDTSIISAIGTPMDSEELLLTSGLEIQLERQWTAGVDGILVAGTMGGMQMLRDQTYRELISQTTRISQRRGEVFVGVGDASWSRTCDRIRLASEYAVDGLVVLTPYLFRFSPRQLTDYFLSLASFSRLPIYLYDLPGLTGVGLDMDLYAAVAAHPNIRGAKISGRIDVAREVKARFGHDLRIIVAEPDKVDSLMREGIAEHLDGMFAIAPEWAVAIASAATAGDWEQAATMQRKLNELRQLLITSPSIWGTFTAVMNAQGIPGTFHSSPYAPLTETDRIDIESQEIVRELLKVTAA